MAPTGFPQPVVVEPISEHHHTIILLHGRGSAGSEFRDELFECEDSHGRRLRDLLPSCKWVFPSAQTLFSETFREDMSQWYDISSLSNVESDIEEQPHVVCSSIIKIRDIVNRERGIAPSGKIVLGGISQGFSVAILLALIDSSCLHTIVGFSSWLPFCSDIAQASHECHSNSSVSIRRHVSQLISEILDVDFSVVRRSTPAMPMFLAHCADDNVVDIDFGRKMSKALADLGHEVSWCESHKGGHWINEPQGIDALVQFLSDQNLTDD